MDKGLHANMQCDDELDSWVSKGAMGRRGEGKRRRKGRAENAHSTLIVYERVHTGKQSGDEWSHLCDEKGPAQLVCEPAPAPLFTQAYANTDLH